jgi:hypothetical protein
MSTATLDYILNKFGLVFDERSRMPVEIPNIGRNGLADLFRELQFKVGVEIGVRDGEYSEILCKANPDLKLYGVDPYEPHHGYRDITRQSTFDKNWEMAHDRLRPFPEYEFVKDYSSKAVKSFADKSLDFVYIDGDHCFEQVAADIAEWLPKIRPGGIISGHDYSKHRGPSKIHVYQAVNGYTDAYGIKPWFVLGLKEITDGVIRDESRSWMWVVA